MPTLTDRIFIRRLWREGVVIEKSEAWLDVPAERVAGKEHGADTLLMVSCASCGWPPSALREIRKIEGYGYWCPTCWIKGTSCALCAMPALKLPVYCGLCRDHYLQTEEV